jgi:hypothetical protein
MNEKVFGGEHLEGLAYRDSAHTEPLGPVLLTDVLAGKQFASEQHPTHGDSNTLGTVGTDVLSHSRLSHQLRHDSSLCPGAAGAAPLAITPG